MDNASKAILIAGAILIAVGLMSLFLIFFTSLREFNSNREMQRENEEIKDWNRFFEQSNYDVNASMAGTQIYGYDVYNIALKAYELNQSYEGYSVKVKVRGSNIVTADSSLDQVKNNLASIGLSYSGLQYEDVYGSSQAADEAAIARQAYINNFTNNTYTIIKINYYAGDGRIDSIEIN